MWGLDVDQNSNRFATCGDDMTVRVYDSRAMQRISMINIGAKARAIAYSYDGMQLAVATLEGKVRHIWAIRPTLFEASDSLSLPSLRILLCSLHFRSVLYVSQRHGHSYIVTRKCTNHVLLVFTSKYSLVYCTYSTT